MRETPISHFLSFTELQVHRLPQQSQVLFNQTDEGSRLWQSFNEQRPHRQSAEVVRGLLQPYKDIPIVEKCVGTPVVERRLKKCEKV